MFLAFALASSLHGADSLVAPVETGGLAYERLYASWTEVVTDRKKANRAGFGSIASSVDSEGFTLEFRIYGDSTAQYGQWKRLERLLDEPLDWVDRTTTIWDGDLNGLTNDLFILPKDDTVAVALLEIAHQDSLEAQRHISISDSYQLVEAVATSSPVIQILEKEVALDSKPISTPTETPSSTNIQTATTGTTNTPDFIEPAPPPSARQETSAILPKREIVVVNEPNIPVQKTSTRPVTDPASQVAKKTGIESSSHPFGEQANYAIIFASFSEEENALRYLHRLQSSYPNAKVWFIREMYRVGLGAAAYPSAELRRVKGTYPKAWVVPLR